MPEEKNLEAPQYPEEFDSKAFLQFIRERFGTPMMAEEELITRFTSFISPLKERGEEVTDEDVKQWYSNLTKDMEVAERPLDVTGNTDISDPHGLRKPTLEKRLEEQDREVSMAGSLLKQQHSPKKPEDRKPRPPVMGDE